MGPSVTPTGKMLGRQHQVPAEAGSFDLDEDRLFFQGTGLHAEDVWLGIQDGGGLNAVMQVVWFPAAPLWAFLIIILDVFLIYHLMLNWSDEVV